MLPALISAGAQFAGGLLGNASAKKAREREYRQQKEFAQSGIQWRVRDAEKAGIHPLYAIGAQTTSYQPQSVGGGDYSFLGEAGQNIGRAIDATRSNPAKAEALALTASQLQLEGLKLDNDFKRMQLVSASRLVNQGANPGLPGVLTTSDIMGMPGQGNAPQMELGDQTIPPHFTPTLKEFGKRFATHSGWSDTQAYEDRYGDWLGDAYGVPVWIADQLRKRQDYFDYAIRPRMQYDNNTRKWRYVP